MGSPKLNFKHGDGPEPFQTQTTPHPRISPNTYQLALSLHFFLFPSDGIAEAGHESGQLCWDYPEDTLVTPLSHGYGCGPCGPAKSRILFLGITQGASSIRSVADALCKPPRKASSRAKKPSMPGSGFSAGGPRKDLLEICRLLLVNLASIRSVSCVSSQKIVCETLRTNPAPSCLLILGLLPLPASAGTCETLVRRVGFAK